MAENEMNEMNRNLVIFMTISGVFLLSLLGYLLLTSLKKNPVLVGDFDSCMKAGYQVIETYPAQCKTPEGKNFVQETSSEENNQ